MIGRIVIPIVTITYQDKHDDEDNDGGHDADNNSSVGR